MGDFFAQGRGDLPWSYPVDGGVGGGVVSRTLKKGLLDVRALRSRDTPNNLAYPVIYTRTSIPHVIDLLRPRDIYRSMRLGEGYPGVYISTG
jgi:hypothetical protein